MDTEPSEAEVAVDGDPAEKVSVRAALRDALRGVHHDYTRGTLGRAILLLAVPMVLEMVMESVFAIVDVYFVARLGADAVATVGLTESMLAIVYAIAMGLSIGVSAIVSRRIGERDPEQAARTAVQGIGVGFAVALVLGVVGFVMAPRLLALVGGEPSVVATGTNYTRVALGANGVIMMLFLINAIFRGAGDPAISMRVLWVANAVNLVLDPCLIRGFGPFPRLGVTGAAIATTTGRGIGVLLQIYFLLRRDGRIVIRRSHLRIDFAIIGRIARLSSTAMLQILIGTASWIGLVRVLSAFGSAAIAGYTIGIRIIMFALLPPWGLANAAATLVGQNLGAGNTDRAERAVWRAGRYNVIFLSAIGALFAVFAGPLVHPFADDPAIIPYATACLRIVSLGFPFYAYGMVLTQSLNGAGDTWTPTLINLGCFWALELPLAWALSHRLGMGPSGAFLSITLAFSVLAMVSALVWKRGAWKQRKV